MNRLLMLVVGLSMALLPAIAQDDFTRIDENGNFSSNTNENKKDSLGSDKEIPKGLKVWTVDTRFGDRIAAQPDTLSHMFMNKLYTYGLRGEYNMLGNLASPRLNRVFVDRPADAQFIFTQPYSYFIVPVDRFLFTNTLSPITNLSYFSCGDKNDGEDHFTAIFGVMQANVWALDLSLITTMVAVSTKTKARPCLITPCMGRIWVTDTRPTCSLPPIIKRQVKTEVSQTTTISLTPKRLTNRTQQTKSQLF